MSAYVLSKKSSIVYHLELNSINFQTDLEEKSVESVRW